MGDRAGLHIWDFPQEHRNRRLDQVLERSLFVKSDVYW